MAQEVSFFNLKLTCVLQIREKFKRVANFSLKGILHRVVPNGALFQAVSDHALRCYNNVAYHLHECCM